MAARGTKRPQNSCGQCGYTWYPRGSNRSLKCPKCGKGDVKIVGSGILGAVLLVGILALGGGNKEDSSATSRSVANPASTVRPVSAGTISGDDIAPRLRRGEGADVPRGVGDLPIIPIPSAPEPSNSNDVNRPLPLAVSRAPNGAAWPVGSGYVDGYASRDYGGSIVNLVNGKNGTAFFVKLVRSGGGVAAASRYMYVGAKNNFSVVNVAPGEYYLLFQDLTSKKYFQTPSFSLSQGVDSRDVSRLKHTTLEFEFSAQGQGYLDARQIRVSEFERW